MKNKIIKELEAYLPKSDNQKSSYWKKALHGSDFYNINKSFGFGQIENKSILYVTIHNFLQRLIFGNKIFKTEEYKTFKKLFDLQNRQIETDAIRHIFSFHLLNNHNLLKNNICVIGDGKINFVGGLLAMKKNNIRIFSINLTEVLIHDYLMIKNSNLINDNSITVVKNEKDLNLPNKKLFLIDASNISFLKNKNINLFINIASMQEMTLDVIEQYFQIIKSNSSFFYCCNREQKKLDNDLETNFNQYPWNNCKTILSEYCPWHRKYYDFKLPFIKKYEGKFKHALVKY